MPEFRNCEEKSFWFFFNYLLLLYPMMFGKKLILFRLNNAHLSEPETLGCSANGREKERESDSFIQKCAGLKGNSTL